MTVVQVGGVGPDDFAGNWREVVAWGRLLAVSRHVGGLFVAGAGRCTGGAGRVWSAHSTVASQEAIMLSKSETRAAEVPVAEVDEPLDVVVVAVDVEDEE